MCCSALHCVAVCCSVLVCAGFGERVFHRASRSMHSVLQRVAACCSVLQRVAVCFAVLQCVALCVWVLVLEKWICASSARRI